MGAAKGNKNALGNKGGGRARNTDLKKLWALWYGTFDFDTIRVHYDPDIGFVGETPFDDFAYKILHRDSKARKMLMDKLFPKPVIKQTSIEEKLSQKAKELGFESLIIH